MIDTDHPEFTEFEGETLGDTLTNLITEIMRLREKLNAKIALITDVDTMIGDKWNVTQDDWNELVNKHYGDEEE
tara:strand:+ start:575 stop:796 length:222 start_codon:yes stop_codon:yes gene_type:complete